MKEILKIVNYYSLNKRFADEEFVYSICNILIKEGGISSYINEIQIKNDKYPDCYGEYFNNLNKVNIYLEHIIDDFSKSSLKFNIKSNEYYFYINLIVLRIIIHEFNHAKQYQKLNSIKNDEETFLCEICTRTLEEIFIHSKIPIKNSKDYYNLEYIKDGLYIINPMERMAELNSLSYIRRLILSSKEIPQKINDIFCLAQINLILKGHKNEYLSPTIKFLDEMGYENDLSKFKFYDGVIDKEFLESFMKYKYLDRIYYGYPIKKEEYDVNKEYKKYLLRKIKGM